MIESPSFTSPTPTNGPPPPVKLVADWLPIPLPAPNPVSELPPAIGVLPGAVDPPKGDPTELEAPGELPPSGDPIELLPPSADPGLVDPGLEAPAAPAPIPPEEAIPAADPSPGVNPVSGFPKNPFTVVFASPTLMIRQSAFPVSGSTYCCRRNRILFVFSNCSIEPG